MYNIISNKINNHSVCFLTQILMSVAWGVMTVPTIVTTPLVALCATVMLATTWMMIVKTAVVSDSDMLKNSRCIAFTVDTLYLVIFHDLFPDIDECNFDNGGCEQVCNNTPGSFLCDCFHGYALNHDGFTCQG